MKAECKVGAARPRFPARELQRTPGWRHARPPGRAPAAREDAMKTCARALLVLGIWAITGLLRADTVSEIQTVSGTAVSHVALAAYV